MIHNGDYLPYLLWNRSIKSHIHQVWPVNHPASKNYEFMKLIVLPKSIPDRFIDNFLTNELLAKVPERAVAISAARGSGRFSVDQSCFCGLFRPKSSSCPRYGDTSPGTAWWRRPRMCPDASCRSYVSKRNNWSAVSPRRPNMRWLITLVWPRTQICLPPNSSLRRAFARSAWLRSL